MQRLFVKLSLDVALILEPWTNNEDEIKGLFGKDLFLIYVQMQM